MSGFLNAKVNAALMRMPLRSWHHYAVLHQGDDEKARLMPRGELAS